MPSRDFLHDAVKRALVKDGWTITHDPLTLVFGARRAFVDLGAEQLVAAEKVDVKIAVEVKSFVGVSALADLEQAIGQYAVYKSWMARIQPQRVLYIAVSADVFEEIFRDPAVQVLLDDYSIHVLVIDDVREEVQQWIN